MRKYIVCILALLLALCASVGALAQENLIQNPDFTRVDENNAPEGWYADCWDSGATQFSVENTQDGKTAALILNVLPNDARWVQELDVEPNTGYVFRCKIKAEGCDPGSKGANISILNTFIYSDSVYDTNGQWAEVELYGVTGSDQTTLLLAARVGGYSATGAGTAWFTDVSAEKADAPAGAIALDLSTNEPYVAPASDAGASTELPDRITKTLLLMAFGFLLAGLALITCARRTAARALEPARGWRSVACLCAIMAAALAVRLYVGSRVRGYSIDINDFMIWGQTFAENGVRFYESTSFCDYPPLYMMLLGLLDLLRRLFGIAYNSTAHLLLIKSVPIFADIAFAGIAYALFEKKVGWQRALLLSAAIAFNPAYIADSAAWGQVDSVLALLIALCLYYAVNGNWRAALPLFAACILTKPQALLFGPVGLAALLMDARKNFKDKRALSRMLVGLASALALVYAVCAPFGIARAANAGDTGVFQIVAAPASWLIQLFTNTVSNYRCLSINACNLYVLLDLNWREMTAEPGLSFLAWALLALSYLYALFLCAFSKTRRSLPLAGAVLMGLLFAFAPMMHERYLFPAIALTVLAYIEYRDWRLLAATLVFSLTQFLNLSLVLQGGTIAQYAGYGHLQYTEQTLNAAISLVNVISALALSWVALDILCLGHVWPLKPARNLPDSPLKRLKAAPDYRLRLRARDYALMSAVTLAYAVVAFSNLGSTKAPQSFWKSAEYKETVVFDLGETRDFRMTYYGGISSSSFTVALSNDGANWTEENYAIYNEGEIFRWLWYAPQTYASGNFTAAYADAARAVDTGEGGARVSYVTVNTAYPLQRARYVRITAMGVGLVLGEFGFWDVENGALWPVEGISGSVAGADYTPLIDEQDTVAETPSYYNGTYFDEIYHARAAYEFIHGLSVLEWSHPHLGKILIMVGVRLFGMTPFGWRCMGALVGVLMLPAMYLLIRQLTQKRWLAFTGMFLLSVDSMHFTQTRIATVDSYAVFFIMLMYLFMFRYYKMNMNRDPFGKTLIPLGLSGLCMGLACASKWIGIYAAAGLAILFFTSVFLRFREYRAAMGGQDERLKAQARLFPARLVLTLSFCVLAFIVVPLVIYYLCYYWHIAPSGGMTLKKVWDMQLQMFNYHKGLSGDTHSFRSPWYEWPTIVRPMWYFSSNVALLGRGVVSSISCMGNPAVWWTGAVALVAMLVQLVSKTKPRAGFYLVAVGFAAQFLPWVLVPRSTFIYHYFASVPFIILATVLMIDELGKLDRYAANTACVMLMALSLALFIAFYPLESGYPCSYDYAMHLRWFNWYNFALQ